MGEKTPPHSCQRDNKEMVPCGHWVQEGHSLPKIKGPTKGHWRQMFSNQFTCRRDVFVPRDSIDGVRMWVCASTCVCFLTWFPLKNQNSHKDYEFYSFRHWRLNGILLCTIALLMRKRMSSQKIKKTIDKGSEEINWK